MVVSWDSGLESWPEGPHQPDSSRLLCLAQLLGTPVLPGNLPTCSYRTPALRSRERTGSASQALEGLQPKSPDLSLNMAFSAWGFS